MMLLNEVVGEGILVLRCENISDLIVSPLNIRKFLNQGLEWLALSPEVLLWDKAGWSAASQAARSFMQEQDTA